MSVEGRDGGMGCAEPVDDGDALLREGYLAGEGGGRWTKVVFSGEEEKGMLVRGVRDKKQDTASNGDEKTATRGTREQGSRVATVRWANEDDSTASTLGKQG